MFCSDYLNFLDICLRLDSREGQLFISNTACCDLSPNDLVGRINDVAELGAIGETKR